MLPISDGLFAVPPGKLAAVVTLFEMTARPDGLAAPDWADGFGLRTVATPDPAWYRALYRRIGAPSLWFGRLAQDDAGLEATLRHPGHAVHAFTRGGEDVGLVEIDRRRPENVEIVYFGLVPELTGSGVGRPLMQEALALAWRPETLRVWLHTCTLDDARAIPFYRRAGFSPYAQAVEVTDDPRLIGLLAREDAGRIPIVERLPAASERNFS